MKKALEVTLGIVTSVGGFLDVGSLATAAQGGAAFGFSLLWAIVLGTICVIFLVEMAGRLAAVSKHTLAEAIRERFGFRFHFVQYCVEVFVDLLVLGAEIGGVAIALQLVTGISFRWWALPVGFALWLMLWKGSFGLIENAVSLLGLCTLVFVAGMFALGPPIGQLAAGLLPSLPAHDKPQYLFTAVSILGATISPYLFFFYSSGAVEDKWGEKDLGVNRLVAALGMGFGSIVSIGVLVVAGMTLNPQGIRVDSYQQAALMLVPAFGLWGFLLFAASLAIACFGAALEISLDEGYNTAQAFGWNWSVSQLPKREARFSLIYTLCILVAVLLMVAGIDPLRLTLITMALYATILPLVITPFLILMNDSHYVGKHRNGWISNTVVIFVIALAFVLAIVAIPLEILGGG